MMIIKFDQNVIFLHVQLWQSLEIEHRSINGTAKHSGFQIFGFSYIR